MKIGVLGKAVLVGLALAALAGCGGGGGGGSAPDPLIRYVNASSDSTGLDFLLNDSTKAADIVYLESSAFQSTDTDDYDLTVVETGTTAPLDAIVFAPVQDNEYVVATVGLLNFGTENLKRLRLVPIDVNMEVPNGNKSRLIVLHGLIEETGFDTPAIDFQNPGDNPQYKVSNINFANTATLEIDSGTQTFEARRTGTESVYTTLTQAFDPGGVYLMIVAGQQAQVGPGAPQIFALKLN